MTGLSWGAVVEIKNVAGVLGTGKSLLQEALLNGSPLQQQQQQQQQHHQYLQPQPSVGEFPD